MIKLFGYVLILSGIFLVVRSFEAQITGSNVSINRSGRWSGSDYSHAAGPVERTAFLFSGIFVSLLGVRLVRKAINEDEVPKKNRKILP